jgi:NitT/TauT family transport system ATP-binding protein
MLSYDKVSLTYPGTAQPVRALWDYDLDVARGEPLSLIGPSGCGKSTSLFLAAGLLQPTSGSVSVAGEKVSKPRLETALILQDFGLLPWKTVYENAALGLRIRRFSPREQKRRTDEALEQVGLGEFCRMYPGELSGGMRQRLALARALALDVDLLLMDEPLSSLDALLREGLQDMLLSLWQKQAYTQVLVTHSIEEAAFLGKRIVVMSPRPGHVAAVIDNPKMGSLDYRASPEFHRICQLVRLELHRKTGGVDELADPCEPVGADKVVGADEPAGTIRLASADEPAGATEFSAVDDLIKTTDGAGDA